MRGIDFKDLLKTSTTTLNEQHLVPLGSLTQNIYDRIVNFDQFAGVKCSSFHFLNKTLKGWRPGEFTLVTGATGSGKTTFLSQVSIDLLKQGIPSLWGSFEIKNEILATTMLQQFSKQELKAKNPELLKEKLDQF